MMNQQQPRRIEQQPSPELSAVSWYTYNKVLPAAANMLTVIDSVLDEMEYSTPAHPPVIQIPHAVLHENYAVNQSSAEQTYVSPDDAARQAVDDAFRS